VQKLPRRALQARSARGPTPPPTHSGPTCDVTRCTAGTQAKLVQCVKRARDIANEQQLPWYMDFWGREFGGDYLASEAGRIKYLVMPKSGSKRAREHLLQGFSPSYGDRNLDKATRRDCLYNCNLNLTKLRPRELSPDSEGWWTFTFVREPVERMLSGLHTIAVGPVDPKLQLWPRLNSSLLGTAFKPDADLITSALERLFSNQRWDTPLISRRNRSRPTRYNVHTSPQVSSRHSPLELCAASARTLTHAVGRPAAAMPLCHGLGGLRRS